MLCRNITYWRLGLGGGDVTTQVCGAERSARRVDKITEGTAARSRNEVGGMSAPVRGHRSEKGRRWSWWPTEVAAGMSLKKNLFKSDTVPSMTDVRD